MDQDSLKYLSAEENQRYNALAKTFESEGWAIVKQFALTNAELQAQRALNAKSWDEHRHATGARAVYLQVFNLAEQTEAEFTGMADAAREKTAAEDEALFE